MIVYQAIFSFRLKNRHITARVMPSPPSPVFP